MSKVAVLISMLGKDRLEAACTACALSASRLPGDRRKELCHIYNMQMEHF